MQSSIERQEEWYHRNENILYTNRFWPGLPYEISRANALRQDAVEVDRVQRILALLTPMMQLGRLREQLNSALATGDWKRVDGVAEDAQHVIAMLETAAREAGVLRKYLFNRHLDDARPTFSPQEEEYARGGYFEVN